MECGFAIMCDEYNGWKCMETDGACMLMMQVTKHVMKNLARGPLVFDSEGDEWEQC